jgi:hypothetical protein
MQGIYETSRIGKTYMGVLEDFASRLGGLKESVVFVIIIVYGVFIEPCFIVHLANDILSVKKQKKKASGKKVGPEVVIENAEE